jgi:ATP-dependent DNA helicase RecG
LGEEQLAWLRQFRHLALSDAEAKALILAKETGAVDNAALRSVTGLDTLAASQILSRLHHQRQLLVRGGAGPSIYYQLAQLPPLPLFDGSEPSANTSDLGANTSDLGVNTSDLNSNTGDLPEALRERIASLTPKARQGKLWPVILWLCALHTSRAETLAALLGRQVTHLKTGHLTELRKQGLLDYLHPEVINHPEQAYVTTPAGRTWLRQQGVEL